MKRFSLALEVLAGLLLGAVALLTCLEVGLRALLGINLPDAYTFAGHAQSIAVFWGMALAFRTGTHISVDLAWTAFPPALQRASGVVVEAVVAAALAAVTWMMVQKTLRALSSHDATQELRLPVWPFAALATAGAALALAFVLHRLIRALRGRPLPPVAHE